MATILVIDDELGIRALLTEILSDEGYTVEVAENAAQARIARGRLQPDLVLLDIWMPDVDGVTLLKEWGATGLLNMPVIMMSGHGTIDTAVEAVKFGACAFLEKPITFDRLLGAVNSALKKPEASLNPRINQFNLINYCKVEKSISTLVDSSVGTTPTVELNKQPNIPVANALAAIAAGAAAENPSQQVFNLMMPLREARDAFEKCYFEFHLSQENGSMTRVAEKTGLERTHLYRKLKQLGIEMGRARRTG
jgi:DNA-binding NtrC family response regulator